MPMVGCLPMLDTHPQSSHMVAPGDNRHPHCQRGRCQCCRQRRSISRIYWTPLHVAAKWDQFEAAKLLIDSGAKVNVLTNGALPQNPLEIAYSLHRTKVGRVLRRAGAELQSDFIKRLPPEERPLAQKFGR